VAATGSGSTDRERFRREVEAVASRLEVEGREAVAEAGSLLPRRETNDS